MGNPLIANRSQSANVGKEPQSLTPVPETYAGENFPYRGTELHGVKPTENPTSVPEWRDDAHAVTLVADAPDPDPIPVRVVDESARELRLWRGNVMYATSVTAQIVGGNDRRTRLVLRNLDNAETVFIGPDSTASAISGYPLAAGQEITLSAESAVYAATAPLAVSPVRVSVLYEYTVE